MGDKKPGALRAIVVPEEKFSEVLGELARGLPPIDPTILDVSDINPAELFAALYNHAKPLGRDHVHFVDETMTPSQAALILGEHGLNYDYFRGRVMKVKLGRMKLETGLYDRDNGQGMAKSIVDSIRAAR